MNCRHLLTAMCVILVAGVSTAGSPEDQWVRYKPANGSFEIPFPGTPKEHTNQVTSPAFGDVTVRSATFDAADGAIYAIYWADFSDVFADEPDADEDVLLDKAIDDFLESAQGEYLPLRRFTFQGHPGRNFLVSTEDGSTTMRVRMYYAGGRFYRLHLGRRDEDTDLDSEDWRFLLSFRLLEGGQHRAQ